MNTKIFSKEKLKQARKDKKLTLQEAAERLEEKGAIIKFNTLSEYEDIDKPNVPRADDMPAISQVYNKSINYFYITDTNVKV